MRLDANLQNCKELFPPHPVDTLRWHSLIQRNCLLETVQIRFASLARAQVFANSSVRRPRKMLIELSLDVSGDGAAANSRVFVCWVLSHEPDPV